MLTFISSWHWRIEFSWFLIEFCILTNSSFLSSIWLISFLCLIKKINLVHSFSRDLTWIFPSRLSTILLEIDKPSPFPLWFNWFLCLESIPNILNSFGMSCLLIPTPVSKTSNFKKLFIRLNLTPSFDWVLI